MRIRIKSINENDYGHNFEVHFLDEGESSYVVSLVSPDKFLIESNKLSLTKSLRWYLEEYLYNPAPLHGEDAVNIVSSLKTWGQSCFAEIFKSKVSVNKSLKDLALNLKNPSIEVISNDPFILFWPWEAIYSDEYGYVAKWAKIQRQLDMSTETHIIKNHNYSTDIKTINILYIISRTERDNIDFLALARPLVDFVTGGERSVKIKMLRPATIESLIEELDSKPLGFYHIVHFDGHGKHNEKGSFLSFENEHDPYRSNDVSSHDFANIIQNYNIPYIVLNACRSAIAVGDESSSSSVAVNLIKAGISGVVAMGYNFYLTSAETFVLAFYKRLFESGDISDALLSARQEMISKNKRRSIYGEIEFHDWMVPVLYSSSSEVQILPKISSLKEMREIPDSGVLTENCFIGRSREIYKLEKAIRGRQSGILIYGMAGEGKTSLINGFLQWLDNTGGHFNKYIWADFKTANSAEEILNLILIELNMSDVVLETLDSKLDILKNVLRENCILIIWDNFETSYDFKDRGILYRFLSGLGESQSKILIASRTFETRLETSWSVHLSGFQGEELLMYLDKVADEIGVEVDMDNPDTKVLIDKLRGNPLMIRMILSLLKTKITTQLLSNFNNNLDLADKKNDKDLQLLNNALAVFEIELSYHFEPILKLIGLSENCVSSVHIKNMLAKSGLPVCYVDSCFKELAQAGLCHQKIVAREKVYIIHPYLSLWLKKRYPAGEVESKIFIEVIAHFAEGLSQDEMDKHSTEFAIFKTNIQNALTMARKMKMKPCIAALLNALSCYEFTWKNFEKSEELLIELLNMLYVDNLTNCSAAAHHMLGVCEDEQGRFNEALKNYDKSISISLKVNDKEALSRTYFQKANLQVKLKKFEEAYLLYKQLFNLERELENDFHKAMIFHHMGMVKSKQMDYAKALEHFEDSRDIYEKCGNQYQYRLAYTFSEIGHIKFVHMDYEPAKKDFEKALQIFKDFDDIVGIADIYFRKILICSAIKDFENMEKYLNVILKLNLGREKKLYLFLAYVYMSMAKFIEGNIVSAQKWGSKAKEIFCDFSEYDLNKLPVNPKETLEVFQEMFKMFEEASMEEDMSFEDRFTYCLDILKGCNEKYGHELQDDLDEVLYWLSKLANQEHAPSQYMFGYLSYEGIGTEKNLAKARFWLDKASKQGHKEATLLLYKILHDH